MLIESKIKRQDGTRVTMDDVVYHFAPDASGAHVCEVSHKRHIQRFLSIPEGYCIAGAPDDEPVEDEQKPVSGDPLDGDSEVVDLVDEDDEEDESDEEDEDDGDIDQLDLDELAERYAANGVKMDRRRSLRTLRSELRAIETGARE